MRRCGCEVFEGLRWYGVRLINDSKLENRAMSDEGGVSIYLQRAVIRNVLHLFDSSKILRRVVLGR